MTLLIALDWGTTSLRAYRLGKGGEVLEQRARPFGVMRLPDADEHEQRFRLALDETCGDWLTTFPHAPLIACGMVGSASGWTLAPYGNVPCDMSGLARQLTKIHLAEDRYFYIIPGVQQEGVFPEVMRGEETQIFGALHHDAPTQTVINAQGNVLIGLPGTHSKWVTVNAGKITSLRTFMTGDLFDAIRNHTILAATIATRSTTDWNAFRQGIMATVHHQEGVTLLSTLFSVRTRFLFKQIDEYQQADYLSGLLIGSELRAVIQHLEKMRAENTIITLIGSPALCQRYLTALDILNCPCPVNVAEQATEQGLWEVARAANLV